MHEYNRYITQQRGVDCLGEPMAADAIGPLRMQTVTTAAIITMQS